MRNQIIGNKIIRNKILAMMGAALGILALPGVALSQQKTVKACQEEWRANKDANQAAGVTEKAYVDKCRGGGAKPAVFHQQQRRRDTGDDGRLGRWQFSVGIRRVSASGELPKNR